MPAARVRREGEDISKVQVYERQEVPVLRNRTIDPVLGVLPPLPPDCDSREGVNEENIPIRTHRRRSKIRTSS